MTMPRLSIFAALVAVCMLTWGGSAIGDDLAGGHMVPLNDQAIADASQKAQATVDDFIAKMQNPPAGTSHYSVKLGIVDEGSSFKLTTDVGVDQAEFFWLVDIAVSGAGFEGTISDTPETVKNVTNGQRIQFKRSDIFDWMYVDGRKFVGNFTACPVLRAGPPEDLKEFEQMSETVCE